MTSKTITLAERLEDIAQDLTFMKDRNTIREAIALLGKADDAEKVNNREMGLMQFVEKHAAPEAPRQQPVAWIDPYAVKDLAARPSTARGVVAAKEDQRNGYSQPLYAAPLSPDHSGGADLLREIVEVVDEVDAPHFFGDDLYQRILVASK